MASTTKAPPIVARFESWDWEAGVAAFLEHIARTRRPDTHTDYHRILRNTNELKRFNGRRLAGIERHEIAAAIRAIHDRGVESHAAHVLRVVRSFWSWLAADGQQSHSCVSPNLLYRLQPPERTRREIGDRCTRMSAPAIASRKSSEPRLPTEKSLGRTLAIAESGALGDLASWAIGLLLYTVQRRRAIVAAYTTDFSWSDPDTPSDIVVWNLPPFYRKTARTRRISKPHRLPSSGSGAELIYIIQEEEDNNFGTRAGDRWLFPVKIVEGNASGRKSPTMHPAVLNHNLLALPNVDISPHGVRRAFHTYGKMHLGFTRDDAKLVLDHNEGRPGDATDAYDWDEEMNRKAVMLAKWGRWIDDLRDAAIAVDPLLHPDNRIELASLIRAQRYNKIGVDIKNGGQWGRSFDANTGEEI